jgi:hypothetical protein
MYGYRKIAVMGVVTTIAITFRLADLINGSEMVDLLSVATGAFFSANLVGKFVKLKDK